MAQTERGTVHPLTQPEQERGLQALAELEQLDQELLKRRGGKSLPCSAQLLNQARDERTQELVRSSK